MRTAFALVAAASLSFAVPAHASSITGTFNGIIVSGADIDNYFGLESAGSLAGTPFTFSYSVDIAQQLADFTIGNGVTVAHYSISSGSASIIIGGQTVSVASTGSGEFDVAGDGSPTDPTTQSVFYVQVNSPSGGQYLEILYSDNPQVTGVSPLLSFQTPYLERFSIAAAPEPATLAIIGAGIAGVVGVRRKNRAARTFKSHPKSSTVLAEQAAVPTLGIGRLHYGV